jgi:hypothetical protein
VRLLPKLHLRSSVALLPLLLVAACAPAAAPVTPVTTPRTIVEMQLRSRATMPASPGVPGMEAEQLDGNRLPRSIPSPPGGDVGWGNTPSLGVPPGVPQ